MQVHSFLKLAKKDKCVKTKFFFLFFLSFSLIENQVFFSRKENLIKTIFLCKKIHDSQYLSENLKIPEHVICLLLKKYIVHLHDYRILFLSLFSLSF